MIFMTKELVESLHQSSQIPPSRFSRVICCHQAVHLSPRAHICFIVRDVLCGPTHCRCSPMGHAQWHVSVRSQINHAFTTYTLAHTTANTRGAKGMNDFSYISAWVMCLEWDWEIWENIFTTCYPGLVARLLSFFLLLFLSLRSARTYAALLMRKNI